MTEYEDKQVPCADCRNMFTFSAQAQKFFAEKGLKDPKRCPPCRDKNRLKHEAKGQTQSPRQAHRPKSAPPPASVSMRDEKNFGVEPSRITADGRKVYSF